MMEKTNSPSNKQGKTVVKESKGEKAAAIAKIEEWGNWKLPQISPENENIQINKIPGSYHEEDEAEEEIRVLIPTKYKKTQERKEADNDDIETIFKENDKEVLRQDSQKMELKNKVKSTANNPKIIIEHGMKKILEQKINLTLEEIFSMSPAFIDKCQNLTTQEEEVIKSVNKSNIQERLLSLELQDYDTQILHYACPLGFMEAFIGREEHPTMALVDTGSEIDIIPEEIAIKASITSRKLNMNLRGIGRHKTSLFGLSEFTPITMITGEGKEIHLLIEKGAVHTILGRPFLADNNVKLEFSHKQGEIFSYPEQDGRQLCLPICKPQAMGWQISPPSGMELSACSEIGKWSVHQAQSSKKKETEETESQSSTRVKKIFLGPNKIPFSAIFDAKNDLNVITQEIALKAELNISPYTSKSTDKPLKPIGQIRNLESSILSSSKESIPAVTHIKSKGKEEEDKLEVEDSEAIEKIKEELKKIRRNLDIAIEDPEKWLSLELSGMNKEDKVESPQKKFKMDPKPPEANSSGIAEDYFNLFQEETWNMSDTDKDLLSEELKDKIINPL
ncbi:hypothetical protein O181_094388 [Austropuccinia psidii MF-1]|uniref:Peptidase A2 domain-containing protein n=1 Tax=Austropuccinia psidii MF-1 TaxID=1389203 RepID=A0A9Q3PA89_9BASI|nr:hypothetical protein [Austropuccinia psidii MF-1]